LDLDDRISASFISAIIITYKFTLQAPEEYTFSFMESITVAASLWYETPSPAQTLKQWVRIPLETWKSLRVSSVFVLSCVGNGLVMDWPRPPGQRSPAQCLYDPEVLIWKAEEEEEEEEEENFNKKF
jgi:hypothetical protein